VTNVRQRINYSKLINIWTNFVCQIKVMWSNHHVETCRQKARSVKCQSWHV